MASKIDFTINRFSITLRYDVSISMNDFYKREGYVQGGNNFHLNNEVEKYQSRLLKLIVNLSKTVNQIKMIYLFLRRYPLKQYYMDKGITQLDYIQYHTEILYHKVHTICEIMKLLVNQVYLLGIPPKDCSWAKLQQKTSKNTPPMRYIDEHFRIFENLIDLRHLNSHRGIYDDDQQDEINVNYGLSFYMAERNGYVMDEDLKKRLPMVLIDYKIRNYKKERLKLIIDIIRHNERILEKFLDSLYPEYEKNKKLLTMM